MEEKTTTYIVYDGAGVVYKLGDNLDIRTIDIISDFFNFADCGFFFVDSLEEAKSYGYVVYDERDNVIWAPGEDGAEGDE